MHFKDFNADSRKSNTDGRRLSSENLRVSAFPPEFLADPPIFVAEHLRKSAFKRYFKTNVKNWIFLFIIITCALLQMTILDCIKILNVKPDLLMVSVVFASIFFGVKQALFFSIFAAILKDALSINAFGINTLLFPLSSFLIINLSKKISLDNNLIRMASVFIIMLINDVITRLIFLFLGNFISWGMFLRTAFMESLYTTFILPLVFKIIKPVLYPVR